MCIPSRIIEHPNYDPDALNYDFSLLKLDRDATGDKTRTVCLPGSSAYDFPKGQTASTYSIAMIDTLLTIIFASYETALSPLLLILASKTLFT